MMRIFGVLAVVVGCNAQSECTGAQLESALSCTPARLQRSDCECLLGTSPDLYFTGGIGSCCVRQQSGWDTTWRSQRAAAGSTAARLVYPIVNGLECVQPLQLRNMCSTFTTMPEDLATTCNVDTLSLSSDYTIGNSIPSACLPSTIYNTGGSCRIQHNTQGCYATATCLAATSTASAAWTVYYGGCGGSECFVNDLTAPGPSSTSLCQSGSLVPSGQYCSFQCPKLQGGVTVNIGMATLCNNSVWTPADVCAGTPAPVNTVMQTIPETLSPLAANTAACSITQCPELPCAKPVCNINSGKCDSWKPDGLSCADDESDAKICIEGACIIPKSDGSDEFDDYTRLTLIGISAMFCGMCCIAGGFWRCRKNQDNAVQESGNAQLTLKETVDDKPTPKKSAMTREVHMDKSPPPASPLSPEVQKNQINAEIYQIQTGGLASTTAATPSKNALKYRKSYQEANLQTFGGESGLIVSNGDNGRDLILVGVLPGSNADYSGFERFVGDTITHVNNKGGIENQHQLDNEVRRARGREITVGFDVPKTITSNGPAKGSFIVLRSTGEVGKVVSAIGGGGATVSIKGRGNRFVPLHDCQLLEAGSAEQPRTSAYNPHNDVFAGSTLETSRNNPNHGLTNNIPTPLHRRLPPALPSKVSVLYSPLIHPLLLTDEGVLHGVKLGSSLDRELTRYYGRRIVEVNGMTVSGMEEVVKACDNAVGDGGGPRKEGAVQLTFAEEERIGADGVVMPMAGFVAKHGEKVGLQQWASAPRIHDKYVNDVARQQNGDGPAPLPNLTPKVSPRHAPLRRNHSTHSSQGLGAIPPPSRGGGGGGRGSVYGLSRKTSLGGSSSGTSVGSQSRHRGLPSPASRTATARYDGMIEVIHTPYSSFTDMRPPPSTPSQQ